MGMSDLLKDRAMLAGLLLRLLLIALLVPQTQNQWFVPFAVAAVENPSFDPWSAFLAVGGEVKAYPYGPVMLLWHLPFTALGVLADAAVGTAGMFSAFGFRLSLLAADVAALFFLQALAPERPRLVMLAFWLSPLSLFVTYWHGQTDIVPVAMMLAALVLAKRYQARGAAAALALACSAKLSMILVAPFLLIYLWQNRRLRSTAGPFAAVFALILIMTLGPWIFSPGYQTMALSNPEMDKIYRLSLSFGEMEMVYLTPMVYALMLYATWRLRRSNFDLLLAMAGVSFLVVVLMTPASPGWYLWTMPFLAIYLARADAVGAWLVAGFVTLVTVALALQASGAALVLSDAVIATTGVVLSPHANSLRITLVVTVGIVVAMRLFREGIRRNDYYRLGSHPLALGIAGDSGAGKDTLGAALTDLFGAHSVVQVYGDAYHKWDREAPMWKAVTHLNPRANDLFQMSIDCLELIDGHTVRCRQYDHGSGRFTGPLLLKPNDVIIVAGLHALLPPALSERLDVRIFIEPEERLRQFWKLRRDSALRNQDQARVQAIMTQREADGDAYIRPQSDRADLVFSLDAVNPDHLADTSTEAPLKLKIIMRDSLYYDRLVRALIGLCGLQIELEILDEGRSVEMWVEGEVWAEDIRLVALTLAPHLEELLDIAPRWQDNMLGILQLVTLLQVDETLHKRTWS